MTEEKYMKTGTTTLGIKCKDGVLLAADKRATAGNYIMDSRVDKVHIVSEDMAVTMAGTASDAQLLVKLIRAELKLKEIRTNRKVTVKEAANLLASMVYNNIRKMSMIPGVSHFVLGGKDTKGFALYDIFPDGTVSPIYDFISSGSGSVIAYGVLETLFKPDLTINEAKKIAVKAINSALKHDSASGDGIDIVTITNAGAKKVFTKRIKVDLTI